MRRVYLLLPLLDFIGRTCKQKHEGDPKVKWVTLAYMFCTGLFFKLPFPGTAAILCWRILRHDRDSAW